MNEALVRLEDLQGQAIPNVHLVGTGGRTAARRKWCPEGEPVVTQQWIYRDRTGQAAFEVHRIQYRDHSGRWVSKPGKQKPFKEYKQTHPGGAPQRLPDRWRKTLRPLYRLPELICQLPATTVFVVEGEPAADALIKAGTEATTSSSGAGNSALTDWSPLAGRSVVIWPDNDQAGTNYAQEVQAILSKVWPAPDVKLVDAARLGLECGGDAVDWLQRGASQ